MEKSNYIESIQQFRSERDQHIIATPRNWLSLCGLFWLEEGNNSFGSSETDQVTLPGLPGAHCGVLRMEHGKAALVEVDAAGTKLNGGKPELRALQTDMDGDPDVIECGSYLMMVIQRGENLLLRVWDTESAAAKEFKGLKYYPVDPQFRITAQYMPYDPPRTAKTLNAIGNEFDTEFCGAAHFILHGVECSLDAQADEDELLFNFSDATRADATYPGGRYVMAAQPVNGEVVLDFNRAVNWPCAYTPYATCPVPPQQNRLPVRIEAGELKYH